MRTRSTSLALALLCAALPAMAAASSEEARAWIKRMNDAVVNLNYDGVLEHRWNGGYEAVRIIHRMRDQNLRERVIFLGAGTEITRNGSLHVEYYHSRRIAKAQELSRSYGYIAAFNGISPESDRLYDIRSGGTQRLPGYPRPTQLISVEPRDQFRYGYRFWLDQQHAMPIKTQLIAANGVVLDEILFQSLTLPEVIDDELLKPTVNTKGYTWLKPDMPSLAVRQAFQPRANLLPAGFRVLRINGRDSPAPPSGPETRFIVSDGIAWASVFVSAADRPQPEGLKPTATSGTFTYVFLRDGHYITVVGEVPAATVKAIAEAVRPE